MDASNGSASHKNSSALSRSLRILMQIRDNAFTQRGGDTVVLERFSEGLRALGHDVQIDLAQKLDPGQFDLIHLYNFCTPESTERFAKNAVSRNTPYVVTTMYEDWPSFFNKMVATYLVFKRYVELGQPTGYWEDMIRSLGNVPSAKSQKNQFTAQNAASLFVSGENERRKLLQDYPEIQRTDLYHYGAQVSAETSDPDLFKKQYGIDNYIMCVGRVEWRKNQLMILKALEDEDIDVVFFTGSFTYQPEYEELCRKFRRRGRTHFIEKVPGNVLSSAFAGARAHVLPSWYELPGLVSIEAAYAGTNIVVTDNGTIRDYVGDRAYYCDPADAQSVRKAILEAYEAPRSDELRKHVSQFTWERSVSCTERLYGEILGVEPAHDDNLALDRNQAQGNEMKSNHEWSRATEQAVDGARQSISITTDQIAQLRNQSRSFGQVNSSREHQRHDVVHSESFATGLAQARKDGCKNNGCLSANCKNAQAHCATNEKASQRDYCKEADAAARQGEYQEAERLFRLALQSEPQNIRAHRGLAVVALTQQKYADAEALFHAALSVDSNDVASATGFAASRWYLGQREEAFELYQKVLERAPDHASTLTYFIGACYELQRFRELSESLERYLQRHPDSKDMVFALSGAYLKEKRYFLAQLMCEEVARRDAEYPGLDQLMEMIKDAAGNSAEQPPQSAPVVRAEQSVQPVVSAATTFEEFKAERAKRSFAEQSASKNELTFKEIASDDSVVIEQPHSDSQLATEILRLEELLRKKDYTHALDLSQKLLQRPTISDHDRALVGILAGEAHACCGDLIAAEKEFRAYDSDRLYGYRAITGKGIVAAERGKWEEAEAFFRHALSSNPRHDVAVAGIAMTNVQRGDLEQAWKDYRRALEINPENMRAILGVIDLGYRLNRLGEVQTVLENYLEFNPGNLSILYAHAGCLYAQGNSGLAKNQLEKIRIFQPEHELANELLDKILSEGAPIYERGNR